MIEGQQNSYNRNFKTTISIYVWTTQSRHNSTRHTKHKRDEIYQIT